MRVNIVADQKNMAKRVLTPEQKARNNAARRLKYATDPEYAEKVRSRNRAAAERIGPVVKRAYNAAYHAANRDEQIARNKAWRTANAERHRGNAKRWREANIERAIANLKAWREANPDYRKHRYDTDADYRLACCLRARLAAAVKRRKGAKAAKTEELMGCDIAFLRRHLEAQFTPEMTWENYGTFWQVDHIAPCATFDLTDQVQQRECFHYSNLRPLPAVDNLARPRPRLRAA